MMTCYKPVLLLCLLLLSSAMSQSNEWSNCSRTCGMGISHRSIPCQNANCTGAEKEFRVCNLKECPDHADFRSEQCQKYGEELIPFINASNPCKLICRLPGQKPVEKAIAIDGTPCLSGSVCVGGMCVAIGCNGILGSEEKTDECERCGSTSGICLRVPCMVTRPTTNGYDATLPVRSTRIKITWTPFCNISGSVPAKALIKGKELTIDGPLEEKITVKIDCSESGHIPTCGYHIPLYDIKYIDAVSFGDQEHQWIVGNDFTACSQACGTGVQRSKMYCQNLETKKIVDASLCDNLSAKHLDTRIRKCVMPPCPYEWHATDWSPCSKSCGGGDRRRNVTCVQVMNKLTDPVSKDPTQCPEYMPRSQETCNHHHCYNHWHKGPWGDCSSSCGNGKRTRNITCINAHGMEIDPNNCSLPTKPKEERNCTGKMCTYKWISSNWSKCSVDCGKGSQTRNVSCQYVKEGKVVSNSLCLQSIKLTTIKQCQDSYCAGTWKVAKWGTCEAPECHFKGFQYRNYYCVLNGSDGLYIDNTKCNNSMEPKGVKKCYKTKGCTPHWVPLSWTECSTTCGRGVTTRGLICMLGNTNLNDTECPEDKPSILKYCNVNVPCPQSCLPASLCDDYAVLYCKENDPRRQELLESLCKDNCCNCNCAK